MKLPAFVNQLSAADKLTLIAYLEQFVTERRRTLIDQVAANRTRHVTVVLEDIFQPHNASAVVRSCECFGIQTIHAIEKAYEYQVNQGVAMGSSKWVSIRHYRAQSGEENPLETCFMALKQQGYTIVATTLREESIPIQALNLEKPLALCFGTEENGLSDQAHRLADHFVQIPMYGFTQSFNISVSAALCLFSITERLRSMPAINWQLSQAEQIDLKIEWLVSSITQGKIVLNTFFQQHQPE